MMSITSQEQKEVIFDLFEKFKCWKLLREVKSFGIEMI